MRTSCFNCARKHISQASVLMDEALNGYPDHLWLAIGHLAEAESELVAEHPKLAQSIRASRKKLEDSGGKETPDFMGMIRMLTHIAGGSPAGAPRLPMPVATAIPGDKKPGALMPPSGRLVPGRPPLGPPTTTPPPVGVPMPADAKPKAGCTSCKERARWAAENANIGPGKKYPRGRLLILTTLTDFHPAYSLTSVIMEQAAAAASVGFRVTIGVHENCDLTHLPELDPSIDVVGALPVVVWQKDGSNQEVVSVIQTALGKLLSAMGPCKIIGHDLLFQEWFSLFAKAIHQLPTKPGYEWFHMAHSSVTAEGIPENASEGLLARRTIPKGHKLLVLNYADVPHFAHYYRSGLVEKDPFDQNDIKVVLNPRDCRVFSKMPMPAAKLISLHTPHLVDVAQLYPVCITRLESKHLAKVIELFGAIKSEGKSVLLMVAGAHAPADAKHSKHAVARMRGFAKERGLTEDELVFSHESLPEVPHHRGLDTDSIRSLFSVTNLFAFPSETEAGSLVLLEAAQSGALLALNESLPCLADYIPRELALWFPWGSLKEAGRGVSLKEMAAQVINRLESDMSMCSRRFALRNYCLESYADRLSDALGE